MSSQVIHMLQLCMILVAGVILILFGHAFIPPEVVYTSTIASVAGVIGARIAQNGYAPPASPAPPPSPPPPSPAAIAVLKREPVA